ncbi:hypothetical protein [Paraburkholderia sp.]|jgi:hypothetical protein|uniref:hypothetical protein n=1 Tax=Paraburkholderia sp. TaxID=1926495 RepID=UPI003C36A5CF
MRTTAIPYSELTPRQPDMQGNAPKPVSASRATPPANDRQSEAQQSTPGVIAARPGVPPTAINPSKALVDKLIQYRYV